MKRLFKKTLIYLVMFMTILPSWFFVGSIQSAKAAGEENAPVIENFDIINPIFSPNGDGIKDTVTIDVGFSESVKAKIDILKESDKTEVINLYQSNSVKNPSPKIWNGKDASGIMVSDGNYLVEVSFNEFVQDKVIVVDTSKPTVITKFDVPYVIHKTDTDKTFNVPVQYSKEMDQSINPTIDFESEDVTFNCTGSWLDKTTFNYLCTISDVKEDTKAPTVTIEGARDQVGNLQEIFMAQSPKVDLSKSMAGDLSFIINGMEPAVIVKPNTLVNQYTADAVYKTDKIFQPADVLTSLEINVLDDNISKDNVKVSINGEEQPSTSFQFVSTILKVNTFKLVDVNCYKFKEGKNIIEVEFSDLAGNKSKFVAELNFISNLPTANIVYSTTDPTNGKVIATLIPSDPEITIVNNNGSATYEFVDNGSFTFQIIDAEGNQNSVVATVSNIYRNTIIDPTVSISGKNINIKWQSVPSAKSYNIYISSKTNGAVTTLNYVKKTEKVTDLEIIQNVGEYGSYYVVITSVDKDGNESIVPAGEKQLLIKVSAPANAVVQPAPTTPEPIQAAPTSSVSPAKVNAAEPVKAEDKTTVQNTDQNGQIKGDESNQNTAAEKTNWTPWIVLFALIILAGAATGGYFYWFNDEDVVTEVKPVKKELKKEITAKKVEKASSPVKPKTSIKKSKRW